MPDPIRQRYFVWKISDNIISYDHKFIEIGENVEKIINKLFHFFNNTNPLDFLTSLLNKSTLDEIEVILNKNINKKIQQIFVKID